MSSTIVEAAICFFFAAATFFLYREKVKFTPVIGRLLWAWRLAYFGTATVFVTVGSFFAIGGNPANSHLIALSLGSLLMLSVLAVAAGFVILLTTTKE